MNNDNVSVENALSLQWRVDMSLNRHFWHLISHAFVKLINAAGNKTRDIIFLRFCARRIFRSIGQLAQN